MRCVAHRYRSYTRTGLRCAAPPIASVAPIYLQPFLPLRLSLALHLRVGITGLRCPLPRPLPWPLPRPLPRPLPPLPLEPFAFAPFALARFDFEPLALDLGWRLRLAALP